MGWVTAYELQMSITFRKKIRHFGSLPDKYKKIVKNCIQEYSLEIDADSMDEQLRTTNKTMLKRHQAKMTLHSLRGKASKINITLSEQYPKWNRKVLGRCSNEDFLVVKFFTNIGFFRERFRAKCKLCGMGNGRSHVMNECDKLSDYRSRMKESLAKIDPAKRNIGLEEALEEIYYRIDEKHPKKTLLVEWMRECIRTLYKDTGNLEKDNGEQEKS